VSWVRRNWFLIGLVLVLAAAWGLPAPADGTVWPGLLQKVLIAAIFLLSGFALRTTELRAGMGHWRLHALVQTLSLVVAPLCCWGLGLAWAAGGGSEGLRIGLLVLGALPTTVTSCVALTAAAGGNTAAALVNASLGNLLGVVVTPLWLLLLVGTTGNIDVPAVVVKLGLLVVLPVLVGQLLQWPLRAWRDRQRGWLGKAPLVLLLVILQLAFNRAFAAQMLFAVVADHVRRDLQLLAVDFGPPGELGIQVEEFEGVHA